MTTAASPPWSIEPLSAMHQRDLFSCGKPALDEYLKLYAAQNQKKNVGRTFVAVKPGQPEVKGYYTLSSNSVKFASLPEEVRKRLPKYPVPVVHMGRLAVSLDVQRSGLGRQLLVDALGRTRRLASDLGICGMEVEALDEEAKGFYLKYGFVELADDTLHLYLPMKVIEQLLFSPEKGANQTEAEMPPRDKAVLGEIQRSWRRTVAHGVMDFDKQLMVVRSEYESLSEYDRAAFRNWLASLSATSARRPTWLPMRVQVLVDNTLFDQDGEEVGGGTASLSPEVMLKAITAWDKNEDFSPGFAGTF